MDETTHPLSKKVLDRANTIEFNTVNLDYFNFLMDVEEKEAEIVSDSSLATKYLHLKECFKENEDLVRNISTILIEINKTLESVGAQVGYRIRDEICFYMAYNEKESYCHSMKHLIIKYIKRFYRVLQGVTAEQKRY